MAASFWQSLLRLGGAVIGAGGGLAVVGAVLTLCFGARSGFFVVLPAVTLLAFGLYGLYVNYLTWRGLSPLAVRHVCGTAVSGLLLGMIGWLGTVLEHPVEPSPIWAFGFLGTLYLARLLHRFASQRLIRLLFPSTRPLDDRS